MNTSSFKPFSTFFILAWLGLLIIIALFIRVYGVGNYYYSQDELYFIGISQGKSLTEVLHYSLHETHPPLGNILRHYWMRISDDIGFVRSLSLIFGILLIPLYYRIGTLLKDQMTGLCAATLIAFSFGCIIQSYTARNYSLLLLLLSLCFYFFCKWRISYSYKNLFLYTLFALLSCCTHFLAICAVFSIAAYETLALWYGKQRNRTLIHWITLNIVIAIIFLYMLSFWRPAFQGAIYFVHFDPDWRISFLKALIYPLSLSHYVFPHFSTPLLLAGLFCINGQRYQTLRMLLQLTGIALMVPVCLILTDHYPFVVTRYDLWVIPFVVPLAALIFSDFIHLLAEILENKTRFSWMPVLTVFIMLAGIMTYDSKHRFSEITEYEITLQNMAIFEEKLKSLNSDYVLVGGRDDISRIMNIHPYEGKGAFIENAAPVKAPYAHTGGIVVNPYYRRFKTWDMLSYTISEAQQSHLMDGSDQLVFIFAYPTNPIFDLIGCAQLKKQLISFPFYPYLENNISLDGIGIPAAMLIIPKKDLLEKVIAPGGTLHGCIDRSKLNI